MPSRWQSLTKTVTALSACVYCRWAYLQKSELGLVADLRLVVSAARPPAGELFSTEWLATTHEIW